MNAKSDDPSETCLRSMDKAESWSLPSTNIGWDDKEQYCLLMYKKDNDCQCLSAVRNYWGFTLLPAFCATLPGSAMSYRWERLENDVRTVNFICGSPQLQLTQRT